MTDLKRWLRVKWARKGRRTVTNALFYVSMTLFTLVTVTWALMIVEIFYPTVIESMFR